MADDGINDEVRLTLGGSEVLISTGYDITQSVLEQPANFSLRLGQGESIRGLIKSIPPNTPFTLDIAGRRRMTGKTDGYRASSAGGSATELTIFGRDVLAPLHDAHIAEEISFKDDTYKSFVQKILTIVGLNPGDLVTLDNDVLENKKLQAGVAIQQLLPIQTVEEILKNFTNVQGGNVNRSGSTGAASAQSLQSKLGERWIDFVRKQLDRAGLFLWGGGAGNIILSKPSSDSKPLYRILRRRGQNRNEVNVIHADLLNDTRPRYTIGVVYGRVHSAKKGINKSIGNSSDDIMINRPPSGYGFGFDYKNEPINTRALVVRDPHCQNNSQAAYLAQRKLAEGRRHGFQLVYTLAGHTAPAIGGGGRVVWTPDTCVEVIDEEFGIDGEIFWIDSADFRRGPQATTTIRMMHKYDVIFGTPDFEGTGTGVGTGFPNTPDPGNRVSFPIGWLAYLERQTAQREAADAAHKETQVAAAEPPVLPKRPPR